MLHDYEILNADLPETTRNQLAIFVLAPRVGIPILEEIFQRPLGQTPNRHRAWLWYTAMRTAGLGHKWDEFVAKKNGGIAMRHCLTDLRAEVSKEEWELFSKRMGYKRLMPSKFWSPPTVYEYWTKGGNWDRRNSLTKIIVLGEHLEGRDPSFNTVTRRFDSATQKRLETEVYNRVNPDTTLAPVAVDEAIGYVRWRMPQMGGKPRKYLAGYRTVSWFFQRAIPHPNGGYIDYRKEAMFPRRIPKNGSYKDPRWLP